MKNTYDGIVIGAGHNGMILAGYMAKAGLDVLVLEEQVESGGGLDSHEDWHYAGHWHNIHSVFHRNVANLNWFKDLEMGEILEYIVPELGVSMCLENGKSLRWYGDIDRTCRSVAEISPEDAETFYKIWREWQIINAQIVQNEIYSPPLWPEQREQMLNHSKAGRTYLEWRKYSTREICDMYFKSDVIKAWINFLVIMRGFEIDARGQGYFVGSMIASGVAPHLCRGTSHHLSDQLQCRIVNLGANLRDTSPVRKILVENGVAKGVELEDGTQYFARQFVASSLNPHLTFMELLGEARLDPVIYEKANNFKYGLITPIASVNLALKQRPIYTAEENAPDIANSFMTIVGLESMEDIDLLIESARRGEPTPRPMMNGATPSVLDPSQAPPGRHTAFMWQLAPYFLYGNPLNWDSFKGHFLESMLTVWRKYAPNLTDDVILNKFSYTPLDIERHVSNMKHGCWMIGEYNEDQMEHKRPFAEASNYRVPGVQGLYLCGSSSHPYGNITGGPGYNCAGVLMEDLGQQPWWQKPDLAKIFQELP